MQLPMPAAALSMEDARHPHVQDVGTKHPTALPSRLAALRGAEAFSDLASGRAGRPAANGKEKRGTLAHRSCRSLWQTLQPGLRPAQH